MEEGWICLHRKILDNPLVCKDAETFTIWCYLLLTATHKEIPSFFKGKKITLKSGQLITGILSLSKKTHIDKNKIQRTLKLFENDKQIEQQTSNQNRLITITKWNEYQNIDKQNEKPMINERETTDKQMITNNNDNNIYYILFNKYKEQLVGQTFDMKIHIINQCRNENLYTQLSKEEQYKLFLELQRIK